MVLMLIHSIQVGIIIYKLTGGYRDGKALDAAT